VLEPRGLVAPADWLPSRTTGDLVPTGSGSIGAAVSVPVEATYDVWLGGSFARGFAVAVDGQPLAHVRYQLSGIGQYLHLGRLELTAGSHSLSFTRPGASLHPGSTLALDRLGPLALTRATDTDAPLMSVPAKRAGELCGHSLDWIEIVRSG
jgi:hypothetical protein